MEWICARIIKPMEWKEDWEQRSEVGTSEGQNAVETVQCTP